MHLFADYIQPITLWLQSHPYWALFFTFMISLSESLAIVGSIIPGSVTMTGIGILVGSGVMRLDLTLLAATLGAIAGDSASYLLGYTFSDKLHTFWPFKNYPSLITYGKTYFARHGGKSVLIGRFIGPLRSIIPLIAGMMHMKHWQFFSANVISGIAWSLLYVLPGVLIGTAGSELSPESATRLFAVVLILLGILWLLSAILKWLIVHINRFLRIQLQDFVSWSGKHPRLAKAIRPLIPPDESNHYQTTAYCVYLITSTLLLCLVTILVIQDHWIDHINQPLYLFLQSLRVSSFDNFFIVLSGFASQLTLTVLFLLVLFISVLYKDWRSALYWISLHLSCLIALIIFYCFLNNSSPDGSLDSQSNNSYPAILLTVASTQFTVLLLYLHKYYSNRANKFFSICLHSLLLLISIGALYLGDHWLTDVIGAYLCGLSLGLLHWILYRRQEAYINKNALPIMILSAFILSSMASIYSNFDAEKRAHQTFLAQYIFTDTAWWQQKKPLLPVYRTNRIGKPVSLFNIQYAGTLNHLEKALLNYGWHKEKDSFFWSILKRVNGQPASQDTPLMAQLYLNRKPVLILTYQPKDGSPPQILRLWRSNFHLKHFRQPIWLGTISPYLLKKNQKYKHQFTNFLYLSEALKDFSLKELPLEVKIPQLINYPYKTKILLIKERAPLVLQINNWD